MTELSDAPVPVFDGEPGEVAQRLDGLVAASEAAYSRLPAGLLSAADQLSGRAAQRLRLSGEHTIVALAGATGSGKSSLFNALTDLDLAGVGLRRPTTSWALACAWGPDGAQELLEWMGIPPRHQVSRMSMLDHSAEDTKLDGLVLLDLPDHDSTEVAHHVEMDRLVQYADLVVWVLDPQKYADAAIHDRYLRPMAAYADVSLVVLNQIDRIPYEQRERALEDVRRIVVAGGMIDVPVLGISASRGDGIDELKRELARRIRERKSAKDRLVTDIEAAAEQIASVGGRGQVPGITPADLDELDRSLGASVGVSQIVDAMSASTRRRAIRKTGWPLTRWVGALRKDPIDRLGLDLSKKEIASAGTPGKARVQRSAAETAVRVFGEKAAVGMERPWRDAVRTSLDTAGDTSTALDAAVQDVDLARRGAAWWSIVNFLQWLALLAFVGGFAWWGLEKAGVGVPDSPVIEGYGPADGQLLSLIVGIAGVVIGIGLAIVSRFFARWTARRRATRVETELRSAIEKVVAEQVVGPVEAELAVFERYRSGINAALG